MSTLRAATFVADIFSVGACMTSAKSMQASWRARVAFRFELFDSQAGTTVWSQSYSHDERVDGKDVSAVAAAINRNVQGGLCEIMRGLDKYCSTAASR